jgi:hypothetical protein
LTTNDKQRNADLRVWYVCCFWYEDRDRGLFTDQYMNPFG